MVAKITFPKRLSSAIAYNEKKVEKGVASCLYAANFLYGAAELSREQKQRYFEHRNNLNDRAQIKTIHISLNFPPGENMPLETLLTIAQTYMEKIGFEEQPYLVYEHKDAGHPHIHIVASTIKVDGSRINTHNLGRDRSAKARAEIEVLFGLKKATGNKKPNQSAKPKKLIYGTGETKEGIANVLAHVFQYYYFTSLPAYNAALQSFNVYADVGKEGGRLSQLGGLHYRALDKKGQKVGVPIKGSDLTGKPTLKNLEIQFNLNEKNTVLLKKQVTSRVEESLLNLPDTFDDWLKRLEVLGITSLVHRSKEGKPYGITFVDHKNRAVFKGSELGRQLSVAAILARYNGKENVPEGISTKSAKDQPKIAILKKEEKVLTNGGANLRKFDHSVALSYPLLNSEAPPFQLRKKRKKKKGNNH